MTPPFRFSVEVFIQHFREQGEAIAALPSDLHKKILYCSALDPLARAVFLKRGNHRTRLVHLLTDHTDWSDSGRVSLYQLSCYLQAKKRTRFRLYREVTRRLNLSPPKKRLLLSNSPRLSELIAHAAPEEWKPLVLHTYGYLFYTYRNNLIHEYREPGYGTDWSRGGTEPFYTNLSSFGLRELVFPLGFVASLYAQALKGAQSELLKQKINPHKRFDFGSRWGAT
jgi:hypothetical protein